MFFSAAQTFENVTINEKNFLAEALKDKMDRFSKMKNMRHH